MLETKAMYMYNVFVFVEFINLLLGFLTVTSPSICVQSEPNRTGTVEGSVGIMTCCRSQSVTVMDIRATLIMIYRQVDKKIQ